MTVPPRVPPARCTHCPRTWEPPAGDATREQILARVVEVALELATHLRVDHGDEQLALALERNIVAMGER